MASPNSQQDLITYIAQLEARITLLERSAVRIDRVLDRTVSPGPTASPGRIIFDTTAGRLYAANNAGTWNALW